ncbi:hypothetical protein [Vibrio phage JSF15]|uniref:Uncharacterized protein n=1 Tax=Vibrio phage JSF15 TaxID=1983598 RepID=A0A2D0YJZ4_9CAUD|nr:hypothetical protein [Vibrio phage JSF15]ASV43074.1 hypothetical protein [Vibrio phage JSF33]
MANPILIQLGAQLLGGVINKLVESDKNDLTDEQADKIRCAVGQECSVPSDAIRAVEAVKDIVGGVSTIASLVRDLVSSPNNDLDEETAAPVLKALEQEER